MKMNQKLYELANEAEPYEVQELEGHRVEIFLMDSFEGVKEEYVIKNGKFAVWTSLDGVNYRLFLENGYYEKLKDLYQAPINQIWMDFWDNADKISSKFSKTFVYPMMGIAVLLAVLSIFLGDKMGSWGTYGILGILLVMFIGMIFINTQTKKKIVNENVKARDKVAEYLGGKRFDELLDLQKEYMDDFYKNLYPEDNLDDDASEEAVREENKAIDANASDVEEDNEASKATLENEEAKEAVDVEVVEAEVVASDEDSKPSLDDAIDALEDETKNN